MIQLEAERRENEEIAAGAIMSAGVGISRRINDGFVAVLDGIMDIILP